jgi:hypothetical protein
MPGLPLAHPHNVACMAPKKPSSNSQSSPGARKTIEKRPMREKLESYSPKAPVVVTSRPQFAQTGNVEVPYAVYVVVWSCYSIKDGLKNHRIDYLPPAAFYAEDVSGVPRKGWAFKCKTEVQFNAAYDLVRSLCEEESRALKDERGAWIPTRSEIFIDLYECSRTGRRYVCVYGETYDMKPIVERSNGLFTDEKVWENVDVHAVEDIIRQAARATLPVCGTFDVQGDFTDCLTSLGYRRTDPPRHVSLRENGEYFAMHFQ